MIRCVGIFLTMFVCLGILTLNDSINIDRAAGLKDETTTVETSKIVDPTKEATTILQKSVAKKDDTSKETTTKATTTESTTAETTKAKPKSKPKPKPSYDVDANTNGRHYSLSQLRRDGKYYDSSGYKFTWYSETVLPGPGLNIPGRHVNDEGYVCDGNGNICLASTELPKGTVVKIPFGDGIGIVYDKCDADEVILDVYIH